MYSTHIQDCLVFFFSFMIFLITKDMKLPLEPLCHCRAGACRLETGQGYCLGLCCSIQPNGRINFPRYAPWV